MQKAYIYIVKKQSLAVLAAQGFAYRLNYSFCKIALAVTSLTMAAIVFAKGSLLRGEEPGTTTAPYINRLLSPFFFEPSIACDGMFKQALSPAKNSLTRSEGNEVLLSQLLKAGSY
jgi:hypothetical protein